MSLHPIFDGREPGSRTHRPRTAPRRAANKTRRTFRPRPDFLEDRTLLATVTWMGTTGGDWNDGSNWSTGTVPAATDDAVILDSDITVTVSGSTEINQLTSQAAIDITGSFTVDGQSTIDNALTIEPGATLTGAGDVTATGLVTWGTGSTLSGTGTLDAQGGMTIETDQTSRNNLDQRTLINDGTAVWTGDGDIYASRSAVFDNLGTLDLTSDAEMSGDFGGDPNYPIPPLFINTGTVVKSVGAAGGLSELSIDFLTTGTVHVEQGSLSLGSNFVGTSTGQLIGDPGTSLELEGLDLDANSSVSGDTVSLYFVNDAGSYSAASGTYAYYASLTGPVTSVGSYLDEARYLDYSPASGVSPTSITTGTLTIEPGSTLTGSGNITATGPFSWGTGGTLSGTGTLDAQGGMTIETDQTSRNNLDQRTLINDGTAVWTGDGDIYASRSAVFDNLGTLDLTSDAEMSGDFGGDPNYPIPPLFINTGTVVKSVGAAGGLSELSIDFLTTGTVHVEQGSLSLGSNFVGTSTGQLIGDPGTSLELEGLDLDANSSVSGDTVSLYFVNDAGSYSAASGTYAYYASLTGPVTSVGSYLDEARYLDYSPASGVSPTSITTGTLTIEPGSTLTGSGNITATGPFSWGTGGTLSGTGTLDAQGGMTIETDQTSRNNLDQRTLINDGTAVWTGDGDIYASRSAVFDNLGTLDLTSDAEMSGDFGGDPNYPIPPLFINTGTVVKSVGAAGGLSELSIDFLTTGTVHVEQGSLSLGSNFVGTSTGQLIGDPGTSLELEGLDLDANSSISGDTVSLYFVNDAGSYSAASGTYAYYASLTGSVTSVGSYLDDARYLDYSPAAGVVPTSITTGALTIEPYATLTGSGDVTATGLFMWGTGGTLSGTGTLDAQGGMTIDCSGPYDSALDQRTLINEATAVWTGDGTIVATRGSVFDNLGSLDLQGDVRMYWDDGSYPDYPTASEFINAGSVVKSVGATTGESDLTMPFLNTGTVDVQQGTLSVGGEGLAGTSTGQLLGDPGTSLELQDLDLDANSSVSGDTVSLYFVNDAGSYSATSGTYAYYASLTGSVTSVGSYLDDARYLDYSPAAGVVPTSITTGALTIEPGATLTGSGDVTATGLFMWGTGGTLSGIGTLDAQGGMTIDCSGPYDSALDQRTLINEATAVWTGDGTIVATRGSVFDNLGSLDLQGDVRMYWDDGSYPDYPTASEFINAGSVVKSVGATTGESDLTMPFLNTGTVDVQQGTLSVGGEGLAGTSTGQLLGDPGTSLELQDLDLDANSSVSGDTVSLYFVNDAGSYSAASGTYAYYASLTGPVTSVGSYLDDARYLDYSPASGVMPTSITTGTLAIEPGGILTGSGDITATGPFSWGIYSTLEGMTVDAMGGISMQDDGNRQLVDATVNNYGVADFVGPTFSYILMIGGSFHNESTGTLNLGGTEPYFAIGGPGADGSQPTFINDGTMVQDATTGTFFEMPVVNTGSMNVVQGTLGLTASNSGTVTVAAGAALSSDDYTQTAGSTILNGGEFDGGTFTLSGGILSGYGTVNANIANAEQVIAGGTGAAGVLTINGDYTQTPSGSLDVEIGGTAAGTQYDQLEVTGQAALAGTLSISLLTGFSPTLGQTFTIASANPLSGTFTNVDESAVTGPVAFQPTYTGTSVVLVAEESSTTTVTSSANPAVFGQSVTFTAKVKAAAPNKGAPTGSVTFLDGSTTLGTATLIGGKATFVTSSLPVGAGAITVVYSGDTAFATSSSAPLTQTVNQDASSTTVTSSANPSVYGQPVTFTAMVSAKAPGSGTPTGTVAFYNGATPVGTGTLNAAGMAAYTTTAFQLGVGGGQSITVAYSGDSNFISSTSSTLKQTVNKDSTTTNVMSSANPSVYGQSVTFTATVAANAPGGGTPTGTVTFKDGSTTLGTGALSNGGVATYTTAALQLKVGNGESITASYATDGNYASSTGTLSGGQTVSQDSTATSLASSVNPSVYGQAVTFTAAVTANAPGSGIPTGTVTFLDGSTTLGTGKVNASGVATYTSTAFQLSVGSGQSITAVYGGDANFATSTSSTLPQTVDQDGTTASGTSAPNPSVYGQSVTFKATLTASAPGSGMPTGTVTFMDGSINLGTGTLSSGKTTVTSNALPAGADTITVMYSGDGNYASTSAVLSQTVNADATKSVVASSANPSVSGQSVTFTATVNAKAPGSGTPTGSVNFMDGANSIGSGTLVIVNGVDLATFTTTSLAVGSHSITAVYAGDGNFVTSTSSILKQVVQESSSPAVVVLPNAVAGEVLGALPTDTTASPLVHDLALEQVSPLTMRKSGR